MTLQLFFALGVIILAGLAYLIRDWHYLLMSITVPVTITLLMWKCIPESPRWQIQKGQYSKARKTLLQAAATNKQIVPEWALDVLLPTHENDHTSDEVAHLHLRQTGNQENGVVDVKPILIGKQNGRFIDLFRSRVLLLRTCVVFFNWFVIFLTFFALTFNLDNLGSGSIHLNICIAGFVELPGYVAALLSIDKVGRRRLLCAMLLLSGFACLGCVVSISLGSHGN
ncbi:hypothetical protein Btru_029268 [Bulinus truncatus]|nr:hypothetical protein Btru_029268 [Bulinus truncatus]